MTKTKDFDFDSKKENGVVVPRTLSDLVPLVDDNRTTGKGHYIVTRKYPTGDVECVALEKNPDDRLYGKGGLRKNEQKTEMDEDTLRRSQARAKRTVKRTLLCLQPDRMMTLTYKENKQEIEQCWKDLTKFARKMKKRYQNFAYVAVPELQKRGAVHFHLAINGYYHVGTVRALWLSVVGAGNIDITSPRTEKGKKIKNPKKIANYIGKYITKSDIVAFNKRRYSRGGDIAKPEILTGWLAYGVPVIGILHKIITRSTRLQPGSPFENPEWKMVYLST